MIAVHVGDIAHLDIDCVVNAANEWLQPGTGVDGALRKAAGPGLTDATAAIGNCPTGSAVITPGYGLKARFVIHAVAPVFRRYPEETVIQLLAACYENALQLAERNAITAIAFPSLGTGVYGVPLDLACPIAVSACRAHLAMRRQPQRIVFCCYTGQDGDVYRRELQNG
jgi:O-acetyl-ADP-ribose deacetylase (regulator of RNase III)